MVGKISRRPVRYLTNNYKDCRLIRLDAGDSRSPIVVVQEGCAPNDPILKTKLYYLQRDGKWIDEFARSTLSDSEAGEIVFESAGEVVQLLSTHFGKAEARVLPVTEEDVDRYVAKMKTFSSPAEAYIDFLARYRAAKKK